MSSTGTSVDWKLKSNVLISREQAYEGLRNVNYIRLIVLQSVLAKYLFDAIISVHQAVILAFAFRKGASNFKSYRAFEASSRTFSEIVSYASREAQ